MKRFFQSACLVMAISLLISVIWLNAAGAATVPNLTWLGELKGGGLVSPRSIDVDGKGNLYVADQLARAVLKYDRYGQYVASFLSGRVTGKGVAVTPDGQTLYVSTKEQGVAIVSLVDGKVSGNLSGVELVDPAEIDLHANGYIFVADAGAGQFNIKIFFPDGTFKSVFAGAGTAAGQFTNISALAVNPQMARVYVANGEAAVPRLQVFDTTGALLSNVPNATLYGADNHTARGVAFDERADGRAYVLRYLPAALRVFDGAFTALLGDFGNLAGKLTAPVDVVYDPVTSRLFVSDGSGVDIFGVDGGSTPVRVNSAPTAALPVAPIGGTVVASAAPTLNWGAATDADGDALTYRVVVKQGSTEVYSTTTAATSVVVPAGILEENGSYVWTVWASDDQASSPASLAAAFVVNALDESPATPVAIAPLAAEKLKDEGALVWTAVSDPDPNDTVITYRVDIAADKSFAAPLLIETFADTTVVLSGLAGYADLEVGAAYFWRVTAQDADGTASAPSATGSFVYAANQLKVVANVADAKVYLRGNHEFAGQFIGVAPLELRNPPAGTFSVVVERPGFDPYVAQVKLAEGASATVAAKLLPARQQSSFAAGTINGRAGIAVAANAAPFLVDFDSDGQLDLLVGDATGQVTLFPTLATPSATTITVQSKRALALPVLPGAVPFVADWDNDGRKDLLVGLGDGTVKLFLNTGTELAPAFDAGQYLMAGNSVLSVTGGASPAVVDLNGDGAKDLVVANVAGRVLAFYNQASDAAPQLAAAAELFKVAGAAQITPVDWDADGDRDLLVTSAGVTIFYRNDLATTKIFTAVGALPIRGAFGMAAVDVNGSKGKDLLIGLSGGKLLFQSSNATLYTGTCMTYLLAEWDEVAALAVAEKPTAKTTTAKTQTTRDTRVFMVKTSSAPDIFVQAGKVRTALVGNKYATAKTSALTLAGMLAIGGEARLAVEAFAALLN